MNREQLMKMSKKELKARLVTVGKEAQDKSGEELTALMDEAKTIGEILDEIKAREELARAAAAAATEGEEPEDDTKGGEGAETKDKARAESGKALKNGKAVKFKAKAIATQRRLLNLWRHFPPQRALLCHTIQARIFPLHSTMYRPLSTE